MKGSSDQNNETNFSLYYFYSTINFLTKLKKYLKQINQSNFQKILINIFKFIDLFFEDLDKIAQVQKIANLQFDFVKFKNKITEQENNQESISVQIKSNLKQNEIPCNQYLSKSLIEKNDTQSILPHKSFELDQKQLIKIDFLDEILRNKPQVIQNLFMEQKVNNKLSDDYDLLSVDSSSDNDQNVKNSKNLILQKVHTLTKSQLNKKLEVLVEEEESSDQSISDLDEQINHSLSPIHNQYNSQYLQSIHTRSLSQICSNQLEKSLIKQTSNLINVKKFVHSPKMRTQKRHQKHHNKRSKQKIEIAQTFLKQKKNIGNNNSFMKKQEFNKRIKSNVKSLFSVDLKKKKQKDMNSKQSEYFGEIGSYFKQKKSLSIKQNKKKDSSQKIDKAKKFIDFQYPNQDYYLINYKNNQLQEKQELFLIYQSLFFQIINQSINMGFGVCQ